MTEFFHVDVGNCILLMAVVLLMLLVSIGSTQSWSKVRVGKIHDTQQGCFHVKVRSKTLT